MKKWKNKATIPQEFIDKFPEINNITLQLLHNRGLTEQNSIDDFLNPNYDDHIHDPFLFCDMKVVVDRIGKAVEKKEKVMVYGDYDADGVCSTAIIYTALKTLGVEVDIYIPFREGEGYGLNEKAVQKIIDEKFNLVITVDCGISNKDEIKLLKDGGVDVIVTDHHQEPLERPVGVPILNSSLEDSGYPFNGLCGGGVAFKLIQALMTTQEKLPAGFDKWLLDLASIATVADMCPLLGENRILVKYGLIVLEKTKRLGLKEMIAIANGNYNKNKYDTQLIGWRLGPRINAAGRMDHASTAFNLIIAEDEKNIVKLVGDLEEINRSRQQATEKMFKEALEQADETKDIIWGVKEGWPGGIVGLVAGKVADRYQKPAIIAYQDGDKFTGSGRSVSGFDITHALKECNELLVRFGGHPQACGFTVMGEENFKKFREKMTGLAHEALKDVDLTPTLDIEIEVSLCDINWELWDDLERFEPFGEGNKKPLICAKNLNIEQIQTVGNDGKHLKVLVSQNGDTKIHKLIGFSFGDWCARLSNGDKIDIVFELDVNEWNGNRELQLKIMDLKLSEQ